MQKICACGCRNILKLPKSKINPNYLDSRKYILGHFKNAHKGHFKNDPVKRTYHSRARNMISTLRCCINNSICNGCIDVAHIDQNHKNNDIENLKPLCRTHHWLLDKHFKNGLRFENLSSLKVMFTISSNKRRYKEIIW